MIIGHCYTVFTISDIDRTVEFYTKLLGFEVVHRQRQSNEYTRKFVGYPDADHEAVMLRIPGDKHVGISSHLLELNQYYSPKGEKVDIQTCNTGAVHMAFVVHDIHDTFEFLKSNGV